MEERGKPLPVETLPRDELEKLQNRRLRYTLREAYEHTLFWHEKFDSLGIKPEDIKNKEGLHKVFKKGLKLTKEDLIKRYNELLPDYLRNMYYEELWTSGFGGTPKRIPFTADSYNFIRDGYQLIGNIMLNPGDRLLSMAAPPPYASGKHFSEGFKNSKISHLQLAVPLPPRILLQIIQTFKPDHVWGLPSKIFDLTFKLVEMGVEPSSLKVNSIGIGGEYVTPERKNKIKGIWNSHIIDEYVNTECGVTGYQCEYEKLHVPENRIILFNINSSTGELVDEKEEGMAILTNLYKENEKPGIFLINYTIGDVIRTINKECECECGRTFTTISYPYRKDEILNIGGVKLYTRDLEKVEGVRDYVNILYHHKKTGKTDWEIRVVTDRPYSEDQLRDEILYSFFASNPPASSFLKEVGGEITLKVVNPDELYKGLKVKPGKPKRVVHITL